MSCRQFILLPLFCMLCACSGLGEARHTVATADSLRVNEGRLYDDSVAMAEAYVTTGKWRLIYPNDYARACYYYGYMLRQHGDQVAAMRAFIAGTHAPYVQRLIPLPQFTDHHILARIYSNMGTMSHLAGEFELSYDMYKMSAEFFRKAGDTTLYYYQHNAMALELAEQNLHDETLTLLGRIETECTDANVLTKTWETKAELYRNLAQYDSAIYAAHQLYAHGYRATSGYVMMAQAFWNLQQYDSALYYAESVINRIDATSQEKYNMLYIITYNNTSISSDEIKQRAEERADIDKEILDPLHVQLAQAIDVLTQDRNKKPHYINIGLLLLSLCIVSGVTWIAIVRIKRHRKHLYAETERERQIQQDLRMQQKELEKQNTHILADIEQLQDSNDALRQENADLSALHSERRAELVKQIESNCKALRNSPDWKKALHWNEYNTFCESADHYFLLLTSKLKATNKLEEKEIRLCILVLLDMFSNNEMAKLLSYGKGIRTYKSRVNAKLGNKGNDLRIFLLNMAIS